VTEEEWLESEDYRGMLFWLNDRNQRPLGLSITHRVSNYKPRLYCANAFAIAYNHVLPSDSFWKSWERGGDGNTPEEQIVFAVQSWTNLGAAGAVMLRDLVGNPFQSVPPLYSKCPGCGDDPQFAASRMCRTCDGEGRYGKPSWITPQVISLAEAAFEDRGTWTCRVCNGEDIWEKPEQRQVNCLVCNTTGTVEGWELDPARLAVLSDAVEEAGCPAEELIEEETRCKGVVEGRGNKGLGYFKYWEFLRCGHRSMVAPQEKDGRCHVRKTTSSKRPHPVLAHLRSPGPHYRGCWALDLILGKE
jgi:hypothetical protein